MSLSFPFIKVPLPLEMLDDLNKVTFVRYASLLPLHLAPQPLTRQVRAIRTSCTSPRSPVGLSASDPRLVFQQSSSGETYVGVGMPATTELGGRWVGPAFVGIKTQSEREVASPAPIKKATKITPSESTIRAASSIASLMPCQETKSFSLELSAAPVESDEVRRPGETPGVSRLFDYSQAPWWLVTQFQISQFRMNPSQNKHDVEQQGAVTVILTPMCLTRVQKLSILASPMIFHLRSQLTMTSQQGNIV